MKNLAIIFIIIGLQFSGFAQQHIDGSITHDGMKRDYILYVPANYTGNSPVPLILNYHGWTQNATIQMGLSDFEPIADTAGFIMVYPQGTLFNGYPHWNVGGFTLGSTTDDVGFTKALLYSISNVYNIDSLRVYSTGFSNGGMMSFLLACQLSEKFAAIASVAGSMTPETFNFCNPQHPTPVLQIHGTTDVTVPYNGNTLNISINDVLLYWVNYNSCDTAATTTPLPNSDLYDGSTVEHIVYDGGDNNVATEHFKVIEGGHKWPGSTASEMVGGSGNMDISASVEIWKFFSKYDINGLIGTTGIELVSDNCLQINIYPNPTHSQINIEGDFSERLDFEIISLLGKSMMTGVVNSNNQQIDLSHLSPNIYFLKINNKTFKILKTE